MSIEQSNQLILLILNSVLMTFLSTALLGGAWLRQNSLSQQLSQIRAHYQRMAPPLDIRNDEDSRHHLQIDLKKLRSDRYRIRNQYVWSRLGMVTLHAVLLTFGISLFTLALRSLISFDSLISIALVLFTIGSGGLLAGTGCILIDIAQGDSDTEALSQSMGKALAQALKKLPRRKIKPLHARATSRSTITRPTMMK
ncbi:MAG: hypothetical protein AAF703_06200 [Cyanobacteria bacterium P01_D01_bin.105]